MKPQTDVNHVITLVTNVMVKVMMNVLLVTLPSEDPYKTDNVYVTKDTEMSDKENVNVLTVVHLNTSMKNLMIVLLVTFLVISVSELVQKLVEPVHQTLTDSTTKKKEPVPVEPVSMVKKKFVKDLLMLELCKLMSN